MILIFAAIFIIFSIIIAFSITPCHCFAIIFSYMLFITLSLFRYFITPYATLFRLHYFRHCHYLRHYYLFTLSPPLILFSLIFLHYAAADAFIITVVTMNNAQYRHTRHYAHIYTRANVCRTPLLFSPHAAFSLITLLLPLFHAAIYAIIFHITFRCSYYVSSPLSLLMPPLRLRLATLPPRLFATIA